MKPLSELSLNKHEIISKHQSEEKGKSKAKRPALQLLNILNDKIEEQNIVFQYKAQLDRLREQNVSLKVKNNQIVHELQIQKRLRKVWNKEDIVLYDDLEGLKRQLEIMKQKYSNLIL